MINKRSPSSPQSVLLFIYLSFSIVFDSFASFLQQLRPEEMCHLESISRRDHDIYPGNYLGGRVVDFNMAWTMYHLCLEPVDAVGGPRAEARRVLQVRGDVRPLSFRRG